MRVHYFSISYTKLNLFMTWVSGADLIRELQSRVTTSLWKNVLWLEAANHVTSFNQSVCFISLRGSYAKLKFVHEIVSRFNSTIYDSFWLCKIKSDFKSWYKISWMANQFEQKSFKLLVPAVPDGFRSPSVSCPWTWRPSRPRRRPERRRKPFRTWGRRRGRACWRPLLWRCWRWSRSFASFRSCPSNKSSHIIVPSVYKHIYYSRLVPRYVVH